MKSFFHFLSEATQSQASQQAQKNPPRGVFCWALKDQAMNTAMKASRKISRAPTTGITTGMCLTTASAGSTGCCSLWADMVYLQTK